VSQVAFTKLSVPSFETTKPLQAAAAFPPGPGDRTLRPITGSVEPQLTWPWAQAAEVRKLFAPTCRPRILAARRSSVAQGGAS
jgi:hypothetical protein